MSGHVAKTATWPGIIDEIVLLAIVHDAVAASDRGTGRTANAVARRVVSPAGPAPPGATPRAIRVVGPHGVPGDASRAAQAIDGSRVTPDIDPRHRISLADRQRQAALLGPAKGKCRRKHEGRGCNCRRSQSHFHGLAPTMDGWLISHFICLLSLLVTVELDQGFSGKFGRGLDAATHRW